ncbi:MAG: hypothetical protein AB7S69_03625 [Salinivirgaceae bacterium]
MKTFRLLLFVFAVALTAVSCSEDEVAPEGKYETTYAKMSSDQITLEFKTKADLQEYEMYMQIELKAGGDFYYYDDIDGWIKTGTWTQSGSKITITEGSDSMTVTQDGSKLIFQDTETDDTGTYNVELHFTKM